MENKHGGARPGSGRPKKEPTVNITFRITKTSSEALKTKLGKELSKEFKKWVSDIID